MNMLYPNLYYMGLDARNPVLGGGGGGGYEQQRRRPACTFAQSDQHLCNR